MSSSRSGTRQRRASTGSAAKPANSPVSSTASVSVAAALDSPVSSAGNRRAQDLFALESSVAELDSDGCKENVTVTVRFRPLSPREIRQGEEIAWYADGETIVRSENNPSVAYAYDKVFGPTTTTRHVYDVAAQHVVSSSMEGVNGTIFAYGVTSSGKTHTMHGDQRSPGIIPLAVKDAFSIIQETPNREFLLRVSYLEIYNEVVNDLLNPAGQNLRIREDLQGTFVEGIKEEVVLSPAHALSLIAAGEEHRHVGSTNFNLLSSRSHTIFTLTIESSPCGESNEGEAVTFSQLNLIDLAGSESSKAETTGLRRKEGSYINKSLLTLGTVISKLSDGKSAHVPYRDSKLTRLLQSSLSGQGRVSLICTVTPSSSNNEETHNTLKFAHRAKCIEIQASQNKIIDEKSLIKKYQNEIKRLKDELDHLKKGIISSTPLKENGGDDIILLKQKLEDGNVKLQSRLEQEEEAKAALLARIQRLTKLILVSTKATQSTRFPLKPGPRRRHSFGEDELAYLPYKRRDMIIDDQNEFLVPIEGNETEDSSKEEKRKNNKSGLLNWFKLKKRDSGATTITSSEGDKSSVSKSFTAPSTPQAESINYRAEESRLSNSGIGESRLSNSGFGESRLSNSGFGESRLSNSLLGESINVELLDVGRDVGEPLSGRETPLAKTMDQVDLMGEQVKILSGEVALQTSVLKRLADEAAKSPKKEQIQVEMRRINNEIKAKRQQISSLERQMNDSHLNGEKLELQVSPSYNELLEQLNEKSFELEVKTADNRIMQEQLQQKTKECEELQQTIASLNQNPPSNTDLPSETSELKQKIKELMEIKSQLENKNQKLSEESNYAKGLASAAGVELKALSEEVTKLMHQNEKLNAELASLKNSPQKRLSKYGNTTNNNSRNGSNNNNHYGSNNNRRHSDNNNSNRREIVMLENVIREKEMREGEFEKRIEEAKQKEAFLENELANMWVLVAKLRKNQGADCESDLGDRL
ncbi:hypothetical protein LUZ60_001340 [Juncus effusus]|nr:hypothetical protein LUZ60_001340 [Juncus effusus]